jgi:hypothetical protein
MDNQSVLVTDFGQFLRARSADDETRYYPATSKAAAQEFDFTNDPVRVDGFAVYDTTISTAYAVALHGTVDEARQYVPASAPTPPQTIFDSPTTDPAPSEAFKRPEPLNIKHTKPTRK